MKKLYLFLSFYFFQSFSAFSASLNLNVLHDICYNGFEDKKFLDIVHAADEIDLIRMINPDHPTPLLWATINGNTLMFKELLNYADFTNLWNQSALYWAVRLRRNEIISLLLSTGINPDAPAIYAPNLDEMNKVKSIKKYIVQKKYWFQKSITPLAQAVKNNDLNLVSLLIKKGAKEPVDHVITINRKIQIERGDFILMTCTTIFFGGCGFLSWMQGAGRNCCPALDLYFSK
jgi:hypothetical protein